MTVQDELPKWMQPPKTLEHQVLMPGAHFRVWRRKHDGFRRVDLEEFGRVTITLYMNDEEREQMARAIWPEGWEVDKG
jgi:uncharacterized membrane protein